MLLIAPSGAEVDAAEESVARLLSNGFSKPKKQSRPTKAQLLEEAGQELTNPELAEAIDKAKQSPAKPKIRKKG